MALEISLRKSNLICNRNCFFEHRLMITRKMEEKFEELKCYFTAKMSEQEENLTKVFNNVLNDLLK